MKSQSRSSAHYILGAVPLLLQSAIWFLAEALLAFGVLLFLTEVLRLTLISPLTYAAVLLLILTVGEATRRILAVSRTFFALLGRLWRWIVSAVGPSMKRSFISLAFFLATLVFFIVAGRLVFLGLQFPLNREPSEAQDLFAGVLTLVTAVIAVFFGGAALIVELIWGAYTSHFARAFVRHRVFLLSLVLMIVIAIANLVPLRFGWNERLATASLISAIYAIICSGLLVGLLTRFLQAPLVVEEVSSQVLTHIRKNLPRPGTSFWRFPEPPRAFDRLLDRLRLALEIHVLGRIPEAPLPIAVPAGFSESLQELVRPVSSACLRAIREDRRDVALACLDAIAAVGTSYLDRRQNYGSPDDFFMTFLYSQLETLFDTALGEANQQYTADIVETACKLGQASLLLTESQFQPDTNSIAGLWADFLAECCLKSLPLRHTRAPVAACEGITHIGRGLLAQRAHTTALHAVAERLERIGARIAPRKGVWPSSITQQMIWGLVLMVGDLFDLALSNGFYPDYAVSTLCNALDSITRTAFAQRRGFDACIRISAPLVGTLWVSGNIVDVFCRVLWTLRESAGRVSYRVLRDTVAVVKLVHHAGLRAIPSGASSREYSSALSIMTWCTVRLLKDREDPHLIREGKNVLRTLLQAAHSYVERVMSESPVWLSHHLRHLSPIYAFLTYFAQSDSSHTLADELSEALVRLSDLLIKSAGIDKDSTAHRELHSYLKMFAAWIHKCFPENLIVDKLVHSLVDCVPPEAEIPGFIPPQMERLGYPSGALGEEEWYVFPSRHWSPGFQQMITDELNDMENYRAFDALLKAA